MDYLQEGLQLVTRAVEEDKNGNQHGACELYDKGVTKLEQALIGTPPSRLSSVIIMYPEIED